VTFQNDGNRRQTNTPSYIKELPSQKDKIEKNIKKTSPRNDIIGTYSYAPSQPQVMGNAPPLEDIHDAFVQEMYTDDAIDDAFFNDIPLELLDEPIVISSDPPVQEKFTPLKLVISSRFFNFFESFIFD
jgi:hypothetical protein